MSLSPQAAELAEKIALPQRDLAAAAPYFGRGCSMQAPGSGMRLAWALDSALQAHARYFALGISDRVYYDTMRDITVWCGNCARPGLRNTAWLVNHMRLELFQIGRLQFQMAPFYSPSFADCPPVLYDGVLHVHIPQGAPLLADDCKAALRSAAAFFQTYFPDYAYRAFVCESWLLFPGNARFMEDSSNILKFASLFHLCASKPFDLQGYDRIFGLRAPRFAHRTSLQKRALRYILRGGRLGTGFGYILKDEVV